MQPVLAIQFNVLQLDVIEVLRAGDARHAKGMQPLRTSARTKVPTLVGHAVSQLSIMVPPTDDRAGAPNSLVAAVGFLLAPIAPCSGSQLCLPPLA